MFVLLLLITSSAISVLYWPGGSLEFKSYLTGPSWIAKEFNDRTWTNTTILLITEDPCGDTFPIPAANTFGFIHHWSGFGCTPEFTSRKLAALGYTGLVHGANFWKNESVAYSARATYWERTSPIPILRTSKNSVLEAAAYSEQVFLI